LRVGGLAIGGPDSTLGKIPVAAREVWSPRQSPLQGRINPVLFSASPGRPRTIRRKSGERCHPVSAPLGHRSVVRVASVSPAGPAGRDGKIRARSPIDILSGTKTAFPPAGWISGRRGRSGPFPSREAWWRMRTSTPTGRGKPSAVRARLRTLRRAPAGSEGTNGKRTCRCLHGTTPGFHPARATCLGGTPPTPPTAGTGPGGNQSEYALTIGLQRGASKPRQRRETSNCGAGGWSSIWTLWL